MRFTFATQADPPDVENVKVFTPSCTCSTGTLIQYERIENPPSPFSKFGLAWYGHGLAMAAFPFTETGGSSRPNGVVLNRPKGPVGGRRRNPRVGASTGWREGNGFPKICRLIEGPFVQA